MEGGIYEEMHSSELVQFVVVQSAAVAVSVAVAVSAIGESGLSGIGVCSLSKGVQVRKQNQNKCQKDQWTVKELEIEREI